MNESRLIFSERDLAQLSTLTRRGLSKNEREALEEWTNSPTAGSPFEMEELGTAAKSADELADDQATVIGILRAHKLEE